MTANLAMRPITGRLARKILIALSLAIGVAAALQPADARDFGHGGGHGWGGGHWDHGWRGSWGPTWSFGFYAPLYAWDPYPYPYPYYYDPPVVAPVYDSDVWPESARAYRQQAYEQAMSAPIGQSIAWSDGGVSGSVTSVRDGHSGDRYCREFLQKILIDGRYHQAYGAACETPDGGWQIVPDNP
jgi:hypothetical protein